MFYIVYIKGSKSYIITKELEHLIDTILDKECIIKKAMDLTLAIKELETIILESENVQISQEKTVETEIVENVESDGIEINSVGKFRELHSSVIFCDTYQKDNGRFSFRVTTKKGGDIPLNKKEAKEIENKYLPQGCNNNVGELCALFVALKIALSKKKLPKMILSDAKCIIDYYSKGNTKCKEKLKPQDIELVNKVVELRKHYESKGGKIGWVSNEYNVADHKRIKPKKIKQMLGK